MQKSNSLHHWRYGTPWLLCFNSPRVHDLYNGIWIQSYSNRSIETQVWSGEFCRHGLLPLQERAHNCHRQTVHCPELAKSCQSRLKKLPSLGMLWWNFFIPESSEWAPNGSKSLSIGGKHHERHGICKCTQQQNINYGIFTTCVISAACPQEHCMRVSSDYDVALKRSFDSSASSHLRQRTDWLMLQILSPDHLSQ